MYPREVFVNMKSQQKKTDVVLIGAGIMSATLGTLLKELVPAWDITLFEKLPSAGEESSNEWNNAGTGHSALCELNYTVEKADGTMDISKAVKINEQFQLSRQFWSYLVRGGQIASPEDFIRPLPHVSLVHGQKDALFLRKRFDALSQCPLFRGMSYSNDPAVLRQWLPLVMEGRDSQEPLAATKIDKGTDVNFGALTRMLISHLEQAGAAICYNHTVRDLQRTKDGSWAVKVTNAQGQTETHLAKFVFIGGGGGSLHLLQKSGIPEGRGIGGFPVSGLFMVCDNPAVVEKHFAKVYGKAKVGAPPMSVPHLDTRYIDGQQSLLFGPFAGFSPKFLKTGSYLDLIGSVKPHNVFNMVKCGLSELPLVKYLVQQLLLTDKARLKDLQEFVPTARLEDWRIVTAGQRVQVIAADGLKFGTEIVHAADGSVAALLGASPGASVVVDIMLELLDRCFPEEFPQWLPKIKEMIPSYGLKLAEHPDLFQEIQQSTGRTLGLIQ